MRDRESILPAVEEDLSLGLLQPANHLDERGFSAAARAGNAEEKAFGNLQVQMAQQKFPLFVAKTDIFELHHV